VFGGSLGASAAIYGILAMALVWAPKNEMECAFVVYFRPILFDCPILVLAGIALLVETTTWTLTAYRFGGQAQYLVTSQALHLMGMGIGFLVGTAMVKRGWVDCEGWDLYSVLAGQNRMTSDDFDEMKKGSMEAHQRRRRHHDAALEQIRQIVADGDPAFAYRAHQKMCRAGDGWRLPETDFLRLIAAFHRKRMWSESVPAMVEYVRSYRGHEPNVRLRLAQVLLATEHNPAQALSVMNKIRSEALSESKRDVLQRLRIKAGRMLQRDPYAVAAEDW
jgi:hypothetical protein